jgi:hypothetical protein
MLKDVGEKTLDGLLQAHTEGEIVAVFGEDMYHQER